MGGVALVAVDIAVQPLDGRIEDYRIEVRVGIGLEVYDELLSGVEGLGGRVRVALQLVTVEEVGIQARTCPIVPRVPYLVPVDIGTG